MEGKKVRLTVDLTRYHAALVKGAEGVTCGRTGPWSRSFDRFTGVAFPGAGVWDILWSQLESVEEKAS